MPRRFAPRNDSGGGRPCTREHPASFSMSLRGAGRPPRDVAIRIPPGKLAKLALLQANPWLFSVFALGAALCFVLPQENGLPRRFAPRNDMLKLAACLRGQGRNDSPKPAPVYACKYVLPGQARSRLQIRLGARLCTRAHLSSFCMSLRGAGRPPRDVAIRIPPGKPTKLTAVQANS